MSVFTTYDNIIEFAEKVRSLEIRSLRIYPCGAKLEVTHRYGAIIFHAEGLPSLVKVCAQEVAIMKNRQQK